MLPWKDSGINRNWNSTKGNEMIKNLIKPSTGLILLIIVALFGSRLFAGQSENTPVIELDQTTYTFPTVFEGELLSHSFKLTNRGTADLEILNVTHT
jgi:hypothetical protein